MIIRLCRKLTLTELEKKVTTFVDIFIATTKPLYFFQLVSFSEFSYAKVLI